MKSGKRVLGIMLVSLLLISSISLVFSADELEGELPTAVPASVGLTNAAPVVVTVYDIVDNDVGTGGTNHVVPVSAGVNNAKVIFLAQDPNGEVDLPGGTEAITLATVKGGITGTDNMEVYVTSPDFSTDVLATSCVEDVGCTLTGGCDDNQREYSCNIPLQYYYEPGIDNWAIYVAVADPSDDYDEDTAKTFSYDPLSAFDIVAPGGGLVWTGVSLSGTDQLPTNDPLQLKNNGNVGYVSASITGVDLGPGGAASGDDMPVNAFSISTQTAGAECDNGVTAQVITTIQASITVGGAPGLIYGDGSGGVPDAVGEELNFCLWDQLDQRDLTFGEDSYSSSWDVRLSYIILSIIKFFRFNLEIVILLSVVAVRVRKGKKKKKKRGKYNIGREELLSLDLILKDKYNIGIEELLQESRRKEIKEVKEELEIQIPVEIFAGELSPAEALCKYLKENKKMKFSEISRLINRDERTVWTNYIHANEKKKKKIYIEKTEKKILISVNIIANRRLSVLESIVKHLKDERFRNIEIAEMLGKDQRNISTLYLRAKKKLG